jgi:hypothetical protein
LKADGGFVFANDLLTDLAGEIRRIAHFLAIVLPEEALPPLLEAVSLPAIRREAEHSYPVSVSFFKAACNPF